MQLEFGFDSRRATIFPRARKVCEAAVNRLFAWFDSKVGSLPSSFYEHG
jgi:hypothetical protein